MKFLLIFKLLTRKFMLHHNNFGNYYIIASVVYISKINDVIIDDINDLIKRIADVRYISH